MDGTTLFVNATSVYIATQNAAFNIQGVKSYVLANHPALPDVLNVALLDFAILQEEMQ
jgi:hypothetical protein